MKSRTENPAGSPKLRPTDQPPKPEEFGKFERLTRKVVNVPKKEVDEKRKEES